MINNQSWGETQMRKKKKRDRQVGGWAWNHILVGIITFLWLNLLTVFKNIAATIKITIRCGCVWKSAKPLNPIVLSDHYPVFKNGYSIGKINPTFSDKAM